MIAKAITFSIMTAAACASNWSRQYLCKGAIHHMDVTYVIDWRIAFFMANRTEIAILSRKYEKRRTLIVGAGSAGTTVARQLLNNYDVDIVPVAFVDDDPRKYKLEMYGLDCVRLYRRYSKHRKEEKNPRYHHCDSINNKK